MKLPRGPLGLSLVLLGAVALLAAAQLALAANWLKLIRVSVATTVYLTPLALLSRRPRAGAPPWWWFAAAGACAGAVSGIARPAPTPALVATQGLAASVFLGTVPWLAVRVAPSIYHRLGP